MICMPDNLQLFRIFAAAIVGCSLGSCQSSNLGDEKPPERTWNKKIVASRAEKFPSWFYDREPGYAPGSDTSYDPETVYCLVKPGGVEPLRRMLDMAGLLYDMDEGFSEGEVLELVVPSFTEDAWVEKLSNSGLVYAASRCPMGAGLGGTYVSIDRQTVYSQRPPPDRESEQKFCRRLCRDFASSTERVTFTIAPDSRKSSRYKVTLMGPSSELALKRTGRWELHEFQFFYCNFGGNSCVLEVNHLDSYTVRAPESEPPRESRFYADKDNLITRNHYPEIERLVGRIIAVLEANFHGQKIDG
jgi:hypothetical protein